MSSLTEEYMCCIYDEQAYLLCLLAQTPRTTAGLLRNRATRLPLHRGQQPRRAPDVLQRRVDEDRIPILQHVIQVVDDIAPGPEIRSRIKPRCGISTLSWHDTPPRTSECQI